LVTNDKFEQALSELRDIVTALRENRQDNLFTFIQLGFNPVSACTIIMIKNFRVLKELTAINRLLE